MEIETCFFFFPFQTFECDKKRGDRQFQDLVGKPTGSFSFDILGLFAFIHCFSLWFAVAVAVLEYTCEFNVCASYTVEPCERRSDAKSRFEIDVECDETRNQTSSTKPSQQQQQQQDDFKSFPFYVSVFYFMANVFFIYIMPTTIKTCLETYSFDRFKASSTTSKQPTLWDRTNK